MASKQLEGLLKSYKIKCRGADSNRKPVFPKEEAETVIVKVYKNGRIIPSCRYRTFMKNDVTYNEIIICNPKFMEREDLREDEFGICPYSVI